MTAVAALPPDKPGHGAFLLEESNMEEMILLIVYAAMAMGARNVSEKGLVQILDGISGLRHDLEHIITDQKDCQMAALYSNSRLVNLVSVMLDTMLPKLKLKLSKYQFDGNVSVYDALLKIQKEFRGQ